MPHFVWAKEMRNLQENLSEKLLEEILLLTTEIYIRTRLVHFQSQLIPFSKSFDTIFKVSGYF